MAFKRAIGICLALSLSAIFWANAGGARNAQNVFPRSLESCRVCHQAIVDSFVQTAHSKTSARAGASSIIGEGEGAFSGEQNVLRTRTEGVYFRMERRGADFYQTAVDASKNRSRTERFEISIGSGRKGQSYLFWKDGLLFQLPASYLTGIEKWINSPGYVDGQINFERVIQPRCLECHSESFRLELSAGKPRYESDYELGITCAKCHGEGENHIAYQSSHPAAHPDEKEARHILNPANFPRDRQLDNCALCHSGAWDPKKPPFTYRPGQRLDEYAPSGAGEADPSADVHGNQIALLRQSRCFRASSELSCSTCHNVHQQERDLVQLAQRCLSCHQPNQCKVVAKTGTQLTSYCIDCHMPNRKSTLIRINTASGQFAPEYRSHAIGIYRQLAEATLQTLREKLR